MGVGAGAELLHTCQDPNARMPLTNRIQCIFDLAKLARGGERGKGEAVAIIGGGHFQRFQICCY